MGDDWGIFPYFISLNSHNPDRYYHVHFTGEESEVELESKHTSAWSQKQEGRGGEGEAAEDSNPRSPALHQAEDASLTSAGMHILSAFT